MDAVRSIILEDLEKRRWSRNAAAGGLGITRVTLFRKRRKLKLGLILAPMQREKQGMESESQNVLQRYFLASSFISF